MMMKEGNFLRQFGAWVTDLRHRYSTDLFFRTAFTIAGLEVALAFLFIGFFVMGILYAKFAQIFLSSPIPVILMCGLSAGIALLFGLLIVRLTLGRARSALDTQKIFISNIAHELRTPLSVIRTITEVEMLDEKLTPQYKKTLLAILEEISRTSGVINNLVSLNRLLRPQRMERVEVDLGAIAERVVARSGKVAFERGIEVLISRGTHTSVYGNPVALEQLIINLTNNAIQYTPKNGRGVVTITIRPENNNHMMLSVSDNGIGIAKDDLAHILEPFYRGDKSRARNIKDVGSGLGLSIVSEIVRAHGGTIRINSTPGKGTTVTVLLPQAMDAK
jgi:two-component system phosphate regulon sensor histidine kinase PhoR